MKCTSLKAGDTNLDNQYTPKAITKLIEYLEVLSTMTKEEFWLYRQQIPRWYMASCYRPEPIRRSTNDREKVEGK